LGEVDVVTAVAYVLVQFVAAVLGAAIVWGTMADSRLADLQDDGKRTLLQNSHQFKLLNRKLIYLFSASAAPPFMLGSNFVTPGLPLGSAFLIEVMGTFLLVWTVCMTAVSKKSIAGNLAPIAIGWSVMLAHLILIPYTGCGINPARSFGPHLVSIMAGETIGVAGWWIYYTAPFVG
jgi:glycerol uptake facilitator-like aquaporin